MVINNVKIGEIFMSEEQPNSALSEQIKKTIENVEVAVEEQKIVEQKLAELESENTELKDKVLRIAADSENLRKRYEKQLEDSNKYAITNFAKDLMSVMDNLFRTLEFPVQDLLENQEFNNIFKGIEMTKDDLVKVFKKYKIDRVAPESGSDFDYNLHQAVSQIETAEFKQGKIVNLMQAGYMISDRLLRPAMVVVAKAPEKE
jgi:molecular chaperone GrpE